MNIMLAFNQRRTRIIPASSQPKQPYKADKDYLYYKLSSIGLIIALFQFVLMQVNFHEVQQGSITDLNSILNSTINYSYHSNSNLDSAITPAHALTTNTHQWRSNWRSYPTRFKNNELTRYKHSSLKPGQLHGVAPKGGILISF
jgi:hypothetical protein